MKHVNDREWYRLDNVAKIYPAVKSYTASNVFKITVSLDHDADPSVLRQAVIDCRKRFPLFYVKMRKGMFWYYYEPNEKEPLVLPESSYVCSPIDIYRNNWFYFTFFYYRNRISLEIFHSLTDGKGALEFLKTVTFRYLELSGYPQSTDGLVLDPGQTPAPEESEDSYLKNFTRSAREKPGLSRSYRMTGTLFPQGGAGVITARVDTELLLKAARSRGATIGQYLSALYVYSIMLTGNKAKLERRPVNLTVPIDIRKHFGSQTLRNFFVVFRSSVLKKAGKEPDFMEILDYTRSRFKEELTAEKLQRTINANVALEKNIAARFVPLPVKYLIIKLVNFANGSGLSTTNLSNLGTVVLPETMKVHVRGFDVTFVLGRRSTHNLGIVTYNGRTSISFTRKVIEDETDRTFFRLMEEHGVRAEIHSNEWEKYIKDTKQFSGSRSGSSEKAAGELPPFERKKRRDLRLAKISSASAAVLILFSVSANIFIWKNNYWSIIASAVVLYIWIIGLLTLKKTLHVGLKMMLHAISLSVLLIIFNAFAYTAETLHRVTWAISYGIPGVLAAFIIAINITMFSYRQNKRNFLLYQISLSVMGMIPLILVLAGLAEPVWPGIAAAVCSYITIAGLFVFAKKIIISEFRKKFHF